MGRALMFAGAAALMFSVSHLSAGQDNDPGKCESEDLGNRNPNSRKVCDQRLDERGEFKARVLDRLRETNQPPVAHLRVADRLGEGRLLPAQVDLDASGSFDTDGFVEFYGFQLFDADTDEILGTVEVTRQPIAKVMVDKELPPLLRAVVYAEDDLGETDTAEVIFDGPDFTVSTNLFTCMQDLETPGLTDCQPTTANTSFTTDDLLEAAQQIDARITDMTPLRIAAWGGGGGRGANTWPVQGGAGGAGGVAAFGVTVADLDGWFGSPASGTTYCYGLGRQGWFTGPSSGSGGASTLLATCPNSGPITSIEEVVLLAGGGAGAGAGDEFLNGGNGGGGGLAFSNGNGGCGAGDQGCASGSTPNGQGKDGDTQDGESGGAGGGRGNGGVTANTNSGQDGVGGLGGSAKGSGPNGWIQGDPMVNGNTGSGGNASDGGGGGGGFGGGASGQGTVPQTGGGGGGSFVSTSTQAYDLPAVLGSTAGAIVFSFQVSPSLPSTGD